MIEVLLDELLEEQGQTFYWLAKETGMSHTTLWRLKKGKALGINFETLEKICGGLNCQPGDVLRLASGKKAAKGSRRRVIRVNEVSSPNVYCRHQESLQIELGNASKRCFQTSELALPRAPDGGWRRRRPTRPAASDEVRCAASKASNRRASS